MRRSRRLQGELLEPRLALTAEVEPNNSQAQATSLAPTSQQSLTGSISSIADEDFFKVTLTYGQGLSINRSSGNFEPEIVGGVELLDDAGNVLSTLHFNSGTQFIAPRDGTYYLRTFSANDFGTFTGSYEFLATTGSYADATESEPNDSLATADAASVNRNFRGAIAIAADLDYWSFSGTSGQVASIDLVNLPRDAPTVIVYRPDGTELVRSDLGMGLQVTLPVSGSYRFALSSAQAAGTFTGQYVGRINLANSPTIIPPSANGFDSAVAVPLPANGQTIVGNLNAVNDRRFFSVDLTTPATLFFGPVVGRATSITSNARLTIYNDRGQILDYRDGATLSTDNLDFAFRTGRFYFSVEALAETALGPFQFDIKPAGKVLTQRDVPLYFIDLNGQQAEHLGYDWVAPFEVPSANKFIQGIFESRYDAWDVDVTFTEPPAGTEHVAQGYGDFGNIGSGGYGAGTLGARRPGGDSVVPCGMNTWEDFNFYGCTRTLLHEFGHATGLLHARNVQAALAYSHDESLFPVGSGYVFPGTDGRVPSSYQDNERDYLDYALQAGRQIVEQEPNNAIVTAINLDPFLAEMKIELKSGVQIALAANASPFDVRVANLNGDAWPDLVVANDGSESIAVHLGTGVGTFGGGVSYVPGFALDPSYRSLTTGDLNGDGRDDVLISSASLVSNNVAVYLANANGTLAAPTLVSAGTGPRRLVLADLNNDTRLDLITGNTDARVGIHLGNGDGTFQTRQQFSTGGSGVQDVIVAQVNADTIPDLITSNFSGDNVSVLRGNGNGTFQAAVNYASGDGPSSMVYDDRNGDGIADLTVLNLNAQTLAVLPGAGNGLFGAAATVAAPADAYSLLRCDLNQDGRGDLVAATDSGLKFLLTAPDNSLQPFAFHNEPLFGNRAVVVADLNQDGRDDFVWTNEESRRVEITSGAANDPRNDRAVVFGELTSSADRDTFAFTAAAGSKYSFDIEAAEYQYPLDAILSIYDSAGHLVAQNDDALDRDTGITSVDPYLVHTFAAAGTYYAQVAPKYNSVGNYRFKLTPATAWDNSGPRVISAEHALAFQQGKSSRQLLFHFNDQLDPATLTAANIMVFNSTSGMVAGTAYFDPFESVLVWTADANLPIGSYTATLFGSPNGIRDLKGNLLDGETDGSYSFLEVSGNGTPGGNFVFRFLVASTDTTPADLDFSVTYGRTAYNRGKFNIGFRDNISLASAATATFIARQAGPDATYGTADDRILPLDLTQDTVDHRFQILAFTRGIPDPGVYRFEGSVLDTAGFTIDISQTVTVGADTLGHGPSVIDTSIQPNSTLVAAGVDSIDVLFSGQLNTSSLTTANFKVRYSPDSQFFNADDIYLTESDGVIAWDPTRAKATFQSSAPLASGRYLLELNGKAGGITDIFGRLLDGEYLDSYIAGNVLPMIWQDTPSGDGVAGGDYFAAFNVSNFTASVSVTPGAVGEDGVENLVYTLTRTGDVSSAGSVGFSISGSAAANDFALNGAATFDLGLGTVSFAPGETTATVTIDPVADQQIETDETVVLTILPGSGYLVGGAATVTGKIQNDDTLRVSAVQSTSAGFTIEFNSPIAATELNLANLQSGGPADVTVTGAATGAVAGSLLIDAAGQRVTFIRTSGLLLPDAYTLTLRSAANGFRSPSGELLDGDANGVAGGDFSQVITVTAQTPNTVIVSLPNVVRAPGQDVSIPADSGSGLPVTLSDGNSILAASFQLRYDPALLTIQSAAVAAGLPSGADVQWNIPQPGILNVQFTSPTPLGAGEIRIVDLQASIPTSAIMGSRQLLDLTGVQLNAGGVPAIDRDAMQLIAGPGDITGNGRHTAHDAAAILQYLAGAGQSAFDPLFDPALIADLDGNGFLSAADALLSLRAATAQPVASIAPLLPVAGLPLETGPLAQLSIAKNLTANPGQLLNVPVQLNSLNTPLATGLQSADLVIYFNPALIDITGVSLGSLLTPTGDWLIASRIDSLFGRIYVSVAGATPLTGILSGDLVQLQGSAKPLAAAGATALNLASFSATPQRFTQLNDASIALSPAMTDAANDAADGLLTIAATSANTEIPTAQLVAGHLQVDGTRGDDRLFVVPTTGGAHVVVRANSYRLGPFAFPTNLTIRALSGQDFIYVDAALPTASITTDPNDDLIGIPPDVIFARSGIPGPAPEYIGSETVGSETVGARSADRAARSVATLSAQDAAILQWLEQWQSEERFGSRYFSIPRRR